MIQIKLRRINIKSRGAIFLAMIACAQFYWLYFINTIPLEISLVDALGSSLLLYGLFFFIKYARSFNFSSRADYVVMIFQNIVFALLWIYFCRYALIDLFATQKNYVALWQTSFFMRGFVGWVILFCFSAINFLANQLNQTRASIIEEQQAQQLRKEAELYKLRQQLQPHFLFNSLNSINALIGRDPKNARNMIQQLSDYLRSTLRKEDDTFITFREELSDLKLYLAIEQVRFGHRLVIEEYIEIDCDEIQIPPFLLQPLVENAIKYGLYGTIGSVHIVIKVIRKKDALVFSITNPYDLDAVATKGTGFGLESIRRRLYLLFARNDLLKIEQKVQPLESTRSDESSPLQTFMATIAIPIRNNI
ncbi:sensor histidine kinase [Arachidicoccus sp.]|uniref:sensor histidine kinase n=1 Tax=Arachidicoccus sp. TaxID=1872624 RepID=UPI003D1FF1E3